MAAIVSERFTSTGKLKVQFVVIFQLYIECHASCLDETQIIFLEYIYIN